MRSRHAIFLAVAWFGWSICPWYKTDSNTQPAPAVVALTHPLDDSFYRPPDVFHLRDGVVDERMDAGEFPRPAWLCFAATTGWCVLIALGNAGWPLSVSQHLINGKIFVLIAVILLALMSVQRSDE
ncbi:MAG: hypothetical protein AAFU85_06280 [Planctomycetota bacterium]